MQTHKRAGRPRSAGDAVASAAGQKQTSSAQVQCSMPQPQARASLVAAQQGQDLRRMAERLGVANADDTVVDSVHCPPMQASTSPEPLQRGDLRSARRPARPARRRNASPDAAAADQSQDRTGGDSNARRTARAAERTLAAGSLAGRARALHPSRNVKPRAAATRKAEQHGSVHRHHGIAAASSERQPHVPQGQAPDASCTSVGGQSSWLDSHAELGLRGEDSTASAAWSDAVQQQAAGVQLALPTTLRCFKIAVRCIANVSACLWKFAYF